MKEDIFGELAGAILFALILGGYNYYYRVWQPKKRLAQIIRKGVRNIRNPKTTALNIGSEKQEQINPHIARRTSCEGMLREVSLFLNHKDSPLDPEEEVRLREILQNFQVFQKIFEDENKGQLPSLEFYERTLIRFLKNLEWLGIDKDKTYTWKTSEGESSKSSGAPGWQLK